MSYLDGLGNTQSTFMPSPQASPMTSASYSAPINAATQGAAAQASSAATPAGAGIYNGPTGQAGFGLQSQLSALPSWATSYLQNSYAPQGSAGYQDRTAQNAQTNFVGQYENAANQYGANAVANPYFTNISNYQTALGKNFNPFTSQISASGGIDASGNVYQGGTQNAFTGAYNPGGGGTMNMSGMDGGYLKGYQGGNSYLSSSPGQAGMWNNIYNWYTQAQQMDPTLTFDQVVNAYNTNVSQGKAGY